MASKVSVMNDSRKMGEMPEHKLFLTMSIPLIISMLVQTLYNIVDSIFVAFISEDALTAVTLVSPLMNLMFAVAAGTATGFNALIARKLGEKDHQTAILYANNGIFLMICSYLAFLVIGLLGSRPFIMLQTDNPDIISYGVTYMTIISCLSIGMFGQVAIERLLQATGKTIFPMITQMSGAITNIIFDWLLIFGIGPFPKMGVAGAAIATIFGQCLAMILGVTFNAKFNKEIKLHPKYMRPKLQLIKNIYGIGVPSIIMISIGSIMTFGLNKILMAFSSTAVAIFGAYFKLQSIVFMPLFGMNNASIPILGYNLGAQLRDRVKKVNRIGITYALAITSIGFVLFQLIPGPLLMLFSASENMLAIGIPALRISCFAFPLAAFPIMAGGLFQASGKSINSMICSLIRQLLVLLPVAYALAQLGNVNYVWASIPIAEVASLIVTIILRRRLFKQLNL